MRKTKLWLLLSLLIAGIGSARALDVELWTRDNGEKIFKAVNKATGESVDMSNKDGYKYQISVEPGVYLFSMYEPDDETLVGALEVDIQDTGKSQTIMFYSGEFKVSNTNADGTPWVEGEDYTLSVDLLSQQGAQRVYTCGRNNEGRITMLVRAGDHLIGTATPSQVHAEEGYLPVSVRKAATNNTTIKLEMPEAVIVNFTVPAEAELQLGNKIAHFVDFALYEPFDEKIDGDKKTLSYKVLPNSQINYRTWSDGLLTRAGYFTSSKDKTVPTEIEFVQADYEAFDPKAYNFSVTSNSGYETGDILVNGNERGQIDLGVGETFKAHAMRSWQLTDSSTANYFMEPDFHYTVLGLDGEPLEGVVEISSNPGSAWADIKAVGPGTAIVLVTYDAIGVDYYSNGVRTPFMGGEIWGAIWPENTAVYVVTVGQEKSDVIPNMFVNEDYNDGALKVAGKNVDAEHDVFYFLDTEQGYDYTFFPEDAAEITVAYPEIGERTATYAGFSSEGVTKNDDGSWTVRLKHGRQIVRMIDRSGHASYQVMRGRRCHREIVNVTRPGSKIYQPGDKVKVQYSGLFHPANKLAGIYNMSAYVTYNGVPNGSSLILSGNQYTFGSAASAQAVTVDLAEDYDVEAAPVISFSNGVIQVNGYGDPIGNHRLVDFEKGRDANFSAIAHKTYFGAIPDASFTVTPFKSFQLTFPVNVSDADVTVSFGGKDLTPNDEGIYEGTYGDYSVVAKKAGYMCYRHTFTVGDDASGLQSFLIEMQEAPEGAWDGKTMTQPRSENDEYIIMTGAELAWFANEVNEGNGSAKAVLGADIELAGYDWTPIGLTLAQAFTGSFRGDMHRISNLYINAPTASYQGFFGEIGGDALISSIIVDGTACVGSYSGAIVGRAQENAVIERVANYADVINTDYGWCGAIIGYLSTGSKMMNCYNAGTITCVTSGGGLAAMVRTATIENSYNIGEVICGANASALAGRLFADAVVTNVFANKDYDLVEGYTLASDEEFASGKVAWLLGDAFGQNLGEDAYPMLDGAEVFKVEYQIVHVGAEAVDAEAPAVLYTNGLLPDELEGEETHWFADAEMTQEVTSVDADASLYARVGKVVGVESLPVDADAEVRWFNLQGIEIAAPARGSHGVYIRVVNGRSEKIAL